MSGGPGRARAARTEDDPIRLDGVTAYAAGAGTGKTYRICEELVAALTDADDPVDPEAVIATTFTNAAAAELESRAQKRLLAAEELSPERRLDLAGRLELASVGTVHSVARQLLERYALRLGLSPRLRVLDADAAERHLERLAARMDPEPWEELADVAERLSQGEPRVLARKLVDEKRANRIPEGSFLEAMTQGAERVCELLSPEGPDSDAPDPRRLRDLAGRALDAIADLETDTQATRDCVGALRGLVAVWNPTWRDLVKAGNLDAGKRSGADACLDDLRAVAGAVRRMPGLHDDVRTFARGLARQVVRLEAAYREYKEERGLLDFVDLEVLLLEALEREDIRRDLEDSFRLVLVDEFQDSSPLQLAIFLELNECVERSIWVGDAKQSIYAFRDADLDLVRAAWSLLDDEHLDSLDTSYRAHRGLVNVLNEVFVPVFGEDARLDADQDPRDGAVERWFLDASNQTQERRTLRAGIEELMEEGRSAGDIAVLVRTNRVATELADVLEGGGIPAVVERPGLLSTRECAAARAGLAVVCDPTDALAAAEVLHLLDEASEETPAWLLERLRALSGNGGEGEEGTEGSARRVPPWPDDSRLERIRALDRRVRSPSDLLRAVIQRLDLPGRAAAWGEPARRAANLDALVALAVRYEEEMREEGRGASLRGLLTWLGAREEDEEDRRPTPRGLDAVTVATCHAAKGLEWPVVILGQAGKRFAPRLWEPRTEGGRVEAGRPLDGRSLRCWIWPFGRGGYYGNDLVSGSGLNDDALASQEGRLAAERQEREEERLLYVAMTRAREKLILAHRGSPDDGPTKTDWLDLVPHREALDPSLDEGVHELERYGTTLRVRVLPGEEREEEARLPEEGLRLVEPVVERGPYPPRFRRPSGVGPLEVAAADVVQEWEGGPEPVTTDQWSALGSAVHAYLAGLPSLETTTSVETRAEVAARVLAGHAVEDVLQPERLVVLGERFRAWVRDRYPDARWYTEVPVVAPREEGGQWRGAIDLLLVWEDGRSVIVDHKIAPVRREGWEGKAAEYAGQLLAYRHAVEAQGLRVEETLLHLVLAGGLVAVH